MSSEKLCGSAAHSWAEGVDTSTIITQAAPTAIAAAVKFCLFISCAPDSISDADENDGPSHHCDRGWRNCQMIVDRLDTGYAFHGNSGCFFFIIGSDKSPQVDGAVADRHVEHRWPPQLRIQSGKHLVTDLRIASACGGCVLCRHACECLKQVCTADDPHDFSILHDRHPFDAVFFSSKTAISPSGVSGVAVITERVMTSVTLCECDFTYSAARTCLPVRFPTTRNGSARFPPRPAA